ncbi:MAG: sulfite exporter TauE/SafE family protein [Gammaproteobacteria bacterium]|nr:sulfite exporter TauE/SafE family protein [Gammaproteobacteria bacterium]
MNEALLIILGSALTIGFVHTLIGPDHYIPLIAMSKARNWSMKRTAVITLICGIAHVLSAAILGMIAMILGLAITKLSFIEASRGSFAAWMLISFGFVYFVWSMYKIIAKKHHHHHLGEGKKEITPWILVLIFVLGPCEPLIPLLMYPAIEGSMANVLAVTLIFGFATIVTMLTVTLASVFGTSFIKFSFMEKYGNALAGAIICFSGIAIKTFGL